MSRKAVIHGPWQRKKASAEALQSHEASEKAAATPAQNQKPVGGTKHNAEEQTEEEQGRKAEEAEGSPKETTAADDGS